MTIRVLLVHALPDEQHELSLEFDTGATVRDAIARAHEDLLFGGLPLADLTVGIWGEVTGPDRQLEDGDRIEFYRPLMTDPKTARRRRAEKG